MAVEFNRTGNEREGTVDAGLVRKMVKFLSKNRFELEMRGFSRF